MKKISFFVAFLFTAVMLFGCSNEVDDFAIILDEVDNIIAESVGVETKPEEVTDFVLPESDVYKDSISDIEDVSDIDEMFTEAGKILSEDIGSIYGGEDTEVVDVPQESEIPSTDEFTLDIDGTYTTAEDVSLYIYLYDELPDNFITKSEARELGWTGGGLDDYAPGMCIGGDYFGNREGLLPKAKGRTYTECDINTLGEDSRGAERIVFSNDGLIYYTDDHYESFVLLYDEDGKAA